MNVSRKDSIELKDRSILEVKTGEMGTGSGARVEKKQWLFQAMEAWLKREAEEGFRAHSIRISLVGRLKSFVSANENV